MGAPGPLDHGRNDSTRADTDILRRGPLDDGVCRVKVVGQERLACTVVQAVYPYRHPRAVFARVAAFELSYFCAASHRKNLVSSVQSRQAVKANPSSEVGSGRAGVQFLKVFQASQHRSAGSRIGGCDRQ